MSPYMFLIFQLHVFTIATHSVGDRYGLQHLSHDALLLLSGELWKHRKRQHLRDGFFDHREIADTKNKPFVSLRQIKRDRIMNPCTDAGFAKRFWSCARSPTRDTSVRLCPDEAINTLPRKTASGNSANLQGANQDRNRDLSSLIGYTRKATRARTESPCPQPPAPYDESTLLHNHCLNLRKFESSMNYQFSW
jgi:hypothetical protein